MKQSMQLLTSSKTNEWYTPPEIMHIVRAVLGKIELDPASNEDANRIVQAKRFYAKEDDGLSQKWEAATLFLNSPYGKVNGKSSQSVWMNYLLSQLDTIGGCIALSKTVPGYVWWSDLFNGKWPGPVCITRDRISFISGDGRSTGKAKSASSFWYYGDNKDKFAERFSEIGRVIWKP